MDKNVSKIKNSQKIIEQVLQVPTNISHRSKTKSDIIKKKFEELILNLELLNNRSNLLFEEFNLDLEKYDELYYKVIYTLLDLTYSEQINNLIKFYLYGRIASDGSIIPILDSEGTEIFLQNPSDLYNLVQFMLKEQSK